MAARLASLFGRESEIETLDTALAATISGQGGLVVIAGEAGIGKSRLLRAFAQRATGAGAQTLSGRGWDFGGAPPLWPWTEVLRGLPTGARGQAATEDENDDRSRFARFEKIADALVEAAAERPLAILLDDLHAFDLPSIAMLRFLVGGRQALRILCVAAHRDVGSGAEADVEDAIAGLARDASILRLRGLDRDAVAALVAEERGAIPAAALLDAVIAATAGNPLFAREVARAGRSERELACAGSGRLALPRTVTDALDAHIASLSEAAQSLLGVAAVVGRPSTAYLLQHVSALQPAETRAAVAELETARLLTTSAGDATRLALAHALVREAAVARLSAETRHALHRRAGEALEMLYANDLDAHLAELARHFVAVAEPGDADKGIRYSIAAAEASSRVCAYEDAVEHYARARGLLEARGEAGSGRHEELLLRLGEAQLGAGRSADAARTFAHVAEAARTRGRPAALACAALGFARTGEYLEDVPDKRRWLEAASHALPREHALSVRVLASLAAQLKSDPLAGARADALADEALALARQQDDPRVIAFAIDAWLEAHHGPASLEERFSFGSELIAIGEATANETALKDGLRWRLSARIERGDLPMAHAENERALGIAARRRVPGPLVNALSRGAAIAFASGRIEDGEVMARRAWGIESRASSPMMGDLLFDAMMAVPRAACGLARELEEGARRFLATAEQLRRPFLLAFGAWMLVALGHRDEARRLLARLAPAGLDAVPDDFARLGVWALAVDVAVAVDDPDTAASAAALLRPYAGRMVSLGTAVILGPVDRYLAKAAARAGAADEARRHFDAAIADAQRSGAKLWHARALLDRGSAARAREIAAALQLNAWRDEAAAPAPSAASSAVAQTPRGRFARDGTAWVVALGGKEAHVKHARGMHHIARLLSEPGREIHALHLDGGDQAPTGDAGPLLDPQAKAAYRRRLEDLREAVKDAEEAGDADRAEDAKSEIEALSHEVARAVGLGGRDRKAGAAAERARMRVTTAIRRAIEVIARAHDDAGAHLQRAIRTGTFLAYDPDPQGRVDWEVSS